MKTEKISFPPKSRFEKSLVELTKKFIDLIKSSGDIKIVNLNEASIILNIQKRIIYNISNILEGFGLIEKIEKNKIKWISRNIDDLQLFNPDL